MLTLCLSAQSKGAKEKMVTRIIVSRCEVDLKKICSEYKSCFGQSLQKTILVSGSHSLSPLACYWFTVRLVLSCGGLLNLLCLCRNIPRETTRRCCSACVDQRSKKNQSLALKGPHWKGVMETALGTNSALKSHPTFSFAQTFECSVQEEAFMFFLFMTNQYDRLLLL